MQCQSCKEDVPAKFAHAISINSCPLCGHEIVPQFIKDILNELETVLNKAKDHMDQMEDWLMTNFQLRRIRQNEVVINKDELPVAEPERPQGKAGKGAAVRRAGDVETGTNPKRVQSAVDFIKGKGSTGLADPSLYVGVDDEGNEVDLASEAADGLDRNEIGEMSSLFGNGIQTDSKEDAQSSAMMQKLKRLSR
jgi:hypothetical protein